MRIRFIAGVSMSVLMALPGALAAEEPAATQDQPQREQRSAVMKKFRVIRIAELQEALNLDEKTTIKVNGVMTRFDEQRDAAKKELHGLMRGLRDMMAADKPDNTLLTRSLDRIIDLRARIHDLHTQELKELRQLLTPTQQAKFVLMMDKFQKKMHQAIRKSWMERGAGMGGGPGSQGRGEMQPPPQADDDL